MCSKRCAKPVRPDRSFADPTWYHRLTATIGAVWSCDMVTNNPLGNRNVSIGMRIGSKLNGSLKNRQRMSRGARVVTTLSIAVAAALVWVALTTFWLWRNQERVVFQPPTGVADAPLPTRRERFAASDGHPIFGYLVTSALSSEPRAVLIAFHGNADLAAWLVPWAQ